MFRFMCRGKLVFKQRLAFTHASKTWASKNSHLEHGHRDHGKEGESSLFIIVRSTVYINKLDFRPKVLNGASRNEVAKDGKEDKSL